MLSQKELEYNKSIKNIVRSVKDKEKREINNLDEISKLKLNFSQKEIRYKNIISGLMAENKNLELSLVKLSELKQKGRVKINLDLLLNLCRYMFIVEQQTDAYLIYDKEEFIRLDNIYLDKVDINKLKNNKVKSRANDLTYIDDN